MSMLNEQIKELREKADELRNVHVDDENVGLLFAVIGAMREAADTIESLRDRLQESCGQVPEQAKRGNGGEHESYSRWYELFGTPERAARTYLDYFLNGCDGSTCGDGCPFFDTSMYMNCALGTDDYDALLEWLGGDA